MHHHVPVIIHQDLKPLNVLVIAHRECCSIKCQQERKPCHILSLCQIDVYK